MFLQDKAVLFHKIVNKFTFLPENRKYILALELVVIFLAILALNLLQPLFTDDWEYAFIYRLFDCENKGMISDVRISSIWDIFQSQYIHYFSWGGRSVNHFIAQVLLLLGSPLNKVINSLAFVFFIYILCQFSKRKNEPIRLSTPLLAVLLLFFTIPVLGSTLLWITGSANYLWGTWILFCFLLPYKNLFEDYTSADKSNALKSIYLFFGGIIAGWTNENMVAAAIFILICFWIFLKIKKASIPTWFFTGLIGFTIGFCFMSFAPGNYIRYNETIVAKEMLDSSMIGTFFKQFTAAISGAFFYLTPIVIIYFCLLVLHRFTGKKDSYFVRLSLICFVGAMVATGVMSFAPLFPERTWFGIIALIVIAMLTLYNSLDFNHLLVKDLRFVVLSLSTVAMLGYYISGYKDLSRSNKVFEQRAKYIEEQKKEGVMDFVFDEEIKTKSRINNLYDLTDDASYWTNCFYARYYGVNSVTVVRSKQR